jgi:hypothetical protein
MKILIFILVILPLTLNAADTVVTKDLKNSEISKTNTSNSGEMTSAEELADLKKQVEQIEVNQKKTEKLIEEMDK